MTWSEAALQHMTRRRVWEQKYPIRACYRGWYERIRPWIVPGPSIEVGGGSAHFKTIWPNLLCSDIVETPYVDLVADALRLPFGAGSIGNLLIVDLLHHLRDPHQFLMEAARVLRTGGRLIAVEPYITPASWLGYRLLHHEDIHFAAYQRPSETPDPWQGNLALPNLVFGRELPEFERRHPALRIVHRRLFGLLDFQLAGGFKEWSLVSRPRLYDALLALDRRLDVLGPLLAFRILCIIEKTGG